MQIGPATRSLVRDRVAKESRLGRLAEFGCGTDFYTQVLAGKADRVVATDLSPGMLSVAQDRIKAANVTFQADDCQKSSFPEAAFDTAFISLVIHFTEPARTLAEMRRILKPAGSLIIANLDPRALNGLDRGALPDSHRVPRGYRISSEAPKGFGKNVMTETQLCDLLGQSGFKVVSTETIRDASRSSHIPVEYIRAVRV